MKTLIGFVGLKGSGKDTAAAALESQGFVNVKFAGALKAMICAYLDSAGVDFVDAHRMVDGDWKEEPFAVFQGKSARQIMQTLGTEWGRDMVGPNIWVEAAINRANQFEKVVFSDVRFPNEVAAIKQAGGTIIRIIRPGMSVDSHPSEALIEGLPFDIQIDNNDTIDTFMANVCEIVDKL